MVLGASVPDAAVILYFLPLAAVIALVCSGMRRESARDVLGSAGRFFAYLVVGTALFSLALQFSLQIPALFYALLAALLAVLGYYTLHEVIVWLRGGPKEEDAGGGSEAAGGRKGK